MIPTDTFHYTLRFLHTHCYYNFHLFKKTVRHLLSPIVIQDTVRSNIPQRASASKAYTFFLPVTINK